MNHLSPLSHTRFNEMSTGRGKGRAACRGLTRGRGRGGRGGHDPSFKYTISKMATNSSQHEPQIKEHLEQADDDGRPKRVKRPRKVYDPSEGIDGGVVLNRKQSYTNVLSSPSPQSAPSQSQQKISISISTTHQTPTIAVPINEVPKVQNYKCDVCLQSTLPTHPNEQLLLCHRCSARAHPSCLGYTEELALRSQSGPWTCMDCKHCSVCNMDHNIGTLIFCDECDSAYHLTCHHPPLEEQPQGSWICYVCAPNSHNNAYDLPGLPTPRESPIPDDESRGSSSGSLDTNVYEVEVPNAVHWSTNQVVDYFNSKGFTKFSSIFNEQDIDGPSLLMLTRSDVLTSLGLKLGPALKIFKQIRILQTRLPDPPMY